MSMNNSITVATTINAPVEKVWKLWTTPQHIMQWNNANENWCTPRAEVDLKEGGSFHFRMETKDASDGFDHIGKYDTIILNELIKYTTTEGRKSTIHFETGHGETILTETFELDETIPADMQSDFVQSILNNFKNYAERSE